MDDSVLMVISHKYRFIFIKTAKTAGTSLEVFLSGVCGDEDVFSPIEPPVPPHRARNYESAGFYNHMPALEIREKVDAAVWRDYFRFCVERNPWDKTLSHYHMERHRAGGKLTLDEYFERGVFCPNFRQYTDREGGLLVDRIVRYEDLTAGLSDVFGSLGVPFGGELGVRAKSEYRRDRRPYREILSPEQRDRIARIFSREIALLGYEY